MYKQIWKDIPTYEGLYQLSTDGVVRTTARGGKFMSPDSHHNVSLYKDKKSRGWQINVLMGCTFLGNDINDPYRPRVLFKDGDSYNLSLDNLYLEDTSDLDGEQWKPVGVANNKKVKDFYYVSNLGRVKSVRHTIEWMNYGRPSLKYVPEMILSLTTDDDGYKTIWLSTDRKPDIVAQVHRLVAFAFCYNDDPEHKVQVNHIDGNPSNNNASNLEWVTPSENTLHAYRTGLNPTKKGRLLRCPVKHLETGQIYNSMSDVDRAMGRTLGYCFEQLNHNHMCRDIEGNVWTLELLRNTYVYVPGQGRRCYFEEHPDVIYENMSHASRDIGRYEGYVSEAVKRGGPISNKYTGEKLHIKFIEE